jgi:hypothetical protein
LLLTKGDGAGAKKEYLEAIALMPNFGFAKANLAAVLLTEGTLDYGGGLSVIHFGRST